MLVPGAPGPAHCRPISKCPLQCIALLALCPVAGNSRQSIGCWGAAPAPPNCWVAGLGSVVERFSHPTAALARPPAGFLLFIGIIILSFPRAGPALITTLPHRLVWAKTLPATTRLQSKCRYACCPPVRQFPSRGHTCCPRPAARCCPGRGGSPGCLSCPAGGGGRHSYLYNPH